MKTTKILKIDGTLLDKDQLNRHLQKIASSHNLKNKSDKQTYPVPNMIENYKTIEQVESSDKAATKASAYKRMSKMYPEGKARRRNQKYKRRQGAQEKAI